MFFAKHGRRQRVFGASLADVFNNPVDQMWRADLFRLIGETPNLDWRLLTKRIGNAWVMGQQAMWAAGMAADRHNILPDTVWLGTTIVDQGEADRDTPKLLHPTSRPLSFCPAYVWACFSPDDVFRFSPGRTVVTTASPFATGLSISPAKWGCAGRR